MTTSVSPSAPQANRVETFLDWFRINSKIVAIGAAVLVIALLTYWFVMRQAANEASSAYRQLQVARQSLSQGNVPLAASDLEKVVQRYGDTPAGVQAAMLLAQVHYDRGEHQKGIDVLTRAARDADADDEASLRALTGDGYSQMSKHQEAATAYQDAADAARFDAQRAMYLAGKARSLMAAGKHDDARTLWSELATNPRYSAVAGEAKVRFGELAAKPAS
jgi:predicted negative regulator of RcsB-dependent stress response